jgi:hypothetical protein
MERFSASDGDQSRTARSEAGPKHDSGDGYIGHSIAVARASSSSASTVVAVNYENVNPGTADNPVGRSGSLPCCS